MDVEQIRKVTKIVSQSIRDACIHALISVKAYNELRMRERTFLRNRMMVNILKLRLNPHI